MADVSDIAKYILYVNKLETEQAGDEAAPDIDPMKLQKLLYYCQGYSLGLRGKPLFADPIEAWKYGPVVRSVYQEFKKYKGRCIPFEAVSSTPDVDGWASAVVHMVMRDKGRYSATALMLMTHNEDAWREARQKADPAALFHDETLSLENMLMSFKRELKDEGSEEEETRLWNSSGRSMTEDDVSELALSFR